MNNNKNWIIGGLIIVVIILGYLFFNNQNKTSQISSDESSITQVQEGTALNNCISAQEAWNHIGENLCVEYFVGAPYQSGKSNVFLNEKSAYTKGFTVTIFANSLGNFNNPVGIYGNKTIQVTGVIKMYQGHPEIIANSPNQIVIK